MKKLKNVQLRTIELLISGSKITDIATQLSLDRSTIYRWLSSNDAFILALNQFKADMQNTIRTRLLSGCGAAIDGLIELSTDSNNAMARLGACRELLSLAGITAETVGDIKPPPVTLEGVRNKMAMDDLNEKLGLFK